MMKRMTALLTACVIALTGCGSSGVSQEEYDKLVAENEELKNSIAENEEEETESAEVIDGFERADYEKYGTTEASDFEGDLIYIEGKVISQAEIGEPGEPLVSLIVEQEDGNRWCVMVLSSEIEGIENKNIRAFGTYEGIVDSINAPALYVAIRDIAILDKARVEIYDNGDYVTVWSFSDYVNEQLSDDEDEQTEESSSETITYETDEETNEETNEETDATYIPTTGESNALKKAKSYLNYSAFSYNGLISQLEYEGFTNEEAVYGVDNCGADWYEQALKKAISYLDYSAFSYDGLIKQLEYEEFTSEQAAYGADNCGADWNEQAAKKAESYLKYTAFSKDGLISQLEYEGFTHEQAVYGAEQNGY